MEFADALNSEAHLFKIQSNKRGLINTSTSETWLYAEKKTSQDKHL